MSITLKRKESGVYRTEDNRYEVALGNVPYYCDDVHPCRVPNILKEKVQDGRYETDYRALTAMYGYDAVTAAKHGKKGYQCQGAEEHNRDSWGVFDVAKDDYVPCGEDFDTKKDAVQFLASHLAKEQLS